MNRFIFVLLVAIMCGCCAHKEYPSLMNHRIENILVDAYNRDGRKGVMLKLVILIDEGTVTKEKASRIWEASEISVEHMKEAIYHE